MPDFDEIRKPLPVVDSMKADGQWPLLEALESTERMRDKGEDFLPKYDGETSTQYAARKKRSFLFQAFSDAVKTCADKPFSKPISIRGDMPEDLAPILDNSDGAGSSLEQFGLKVFRESVRYGLSHIFVDYSDTPARNADEERRMSPYFVHVPPTHMLAWEVERIGGVENLLMARWLEYTIGSSGKVVEQIREVNAPQNSEAGTWALYQQDTEDPKNWILIKEGTHTFPGVPLHTFYTDRVSTMLANPPLLALAEMNLEHWQKKSDLNNILHYASVPMLFRKGFSEEENERPIKVGVQESISTTNENAAVSWVELGGKQIELGQAEIRHIEERMEILAAQPFVPRKKATRTATGEALDASKSESRVQTWIRSLERTLERCFISAARWKNSTLPEDFGINIFSDFVIGTRNADDAKIIQADRARGDIDLETYLDEMRRRGVYDDTVSAETVKERLLDDPATI